MAEQTTERIREIREINYLSKDFDGYKRDLINFIKKKNTKPMHAKDPRITLLLSSILSALQYGHILIEVDEELP